MIEGYTMNPLVFHLLDLQSRDMHVEAEDDEHREVTYEDVSDEDEYPRRVKKTPFHAREMIIHLFGSTEAGIPVRCDVSGFRPTLYLRLPEERTSAAITSITTYLTAQGIPIGQIQMTRVMKKVFYGFTANTFLPFLQLDVPSLSLFRTLRGLFLDDQLRPATKKALEAPLRNVTIEVFEANLDPMLRFLHVQEISPCGWVAIQGGTISETADMITVECDSTQVRPTKGPRPTAPFLTASWDIECFSMTGDFPLAKRTWKKAAQEVEHCSAEEAAERVLASLSVGQTPVSTLPKGMTPIYMAWKGKLGQAGAGASGMERARRALTSAVFQERWSHGGDRTEHVEELLQSTLGPLLMLQGDPVIQIGTTLLRGAEVERHLFVFPDCAPLADIVVHAYPTEGEMIHAWFQWMNEKNPDILLGYNIFGFDEAYLWHRAEELKLLQGTSPLHEFTRLFDLSGEMKLEEKFLSSSAMGDNRMYIWSAHGRLQVDMFHSVKRNHVLPSYKLDEVAKHFLSGALKTHHYDPSTSTLTLHVGGAFQEVRVGRAIALLDETGETVSPKLIVHSVQGGVLTCVLPLEQEGLDEMEDATKWVIVKDDVSPQDIFRLHRESAEGRAIVGKYCLQDCDLVIELYKKLETFNNAMSMANVCSVPVTYIFTRGQGIKIESLMFKACRERDILIPVLTIPTSGSDDSYEGAIVLDPQPGFYTSPVGVCDFASLYPSTIVSENISHDSLLWIKDFTDEGILIKHQWGSDAYEDCAGYAYTDIEYDIWRSDPTDSRKQPRKMKCGRRICRFAQPLDGTKSTLPQITTWLLSARSAKKKEMKAEKDPERYALLDAEQLAYKLTGNSLYGQLGSGTFKIRLQALAASVTAYGRKQILFAKAAIERFYGPESKDPRCSARCMAKVVYGDSVTGDTPVRIKQLPRDGSADSTLWTLPIDSLHTLEPGHGWWAEGDKEFYELERCWSWTETGWTRIHRVIRHRLPVTKQIHRVFLTVGWIDVTSDHSLLTAAGEMITPREAVMGTRLLSTLYPEGDVVRRVDVLVSSEANRQPMVYDLTTDNHHFQAGPEGLIVHNTDSLFVEFNPRNPETGERLEGREARQATIDITGEAGHFISKVLAPPHDFEFDKCFDPLLMFSKKRYAGNMYEENADDYVHKYMGIALKRRDNAPIVKTIFGGAMKMLLDKRDVVGAFHFVKEKCAELVTGKVSMGQLMVTKSLRADYADPTRIAHKVLADRITLRDPGNAPAAGDRIGYVYVRPKAGQLASALQGDRIETPLFIKEHGLLPDYKHYIEHQLQNPISQAFGLLLELVPGFRGDMLHGCPLAVDDLDRFLAMREAKAAELLFAESLKTLDMDGTRLAMAHMFKGAATVVKRAVKEPIARASISAATSSSETSAATATSATASSETKKPAIQMRMSSYLQDSMMMDEMKKKERARKAKETREAKKVASANTSAAATSASST
jgi:DNA polymerase elongation subunit (family B)